MENELEPNILFQTDKGIIRLELCGSFSSAYGYQVENQLDQCVHKLQNLLTKDKNFLSIDFKRIQRIDTLGGWLINKLIFQCEKEGTKTELLNVSEEQKILLKEVQYQDFFKDDIPAKKGFLNWILSLLEDIGKNVYSSYNDVINGISFLGEIVDSLFRGFRHRRGFRFPSIVTQMEVIAWQGLPIVALISFVVGGIIAQQGVFQLSYFGATAFTVDLIGILTLRELAVLLTSIMVAGRSGSAFTAEIGSMKMNEEIDALTVMGLNSIQVLIVPRLIALIISLPLLTFLASMASFLGGGLVCWIYGGISPDIFLARLQDSIGMNTFLVGIIKAPFMALVIGLIATIEGMRVQGSAESLGACVTSSVVKAIFMVIVMDGLFAIFFASINY